MDQKSSLRGRKRRSLWLFLLLELTVLAAVWQFRNREPDAMQDGLIADVESGPQLADIEASGPNADGSVAFSGEDADSGGATVGYSE